MRIFLIVLLACGSLYAGEPEKLNFFGRMKKSVVSVVDVLTPRISFDDKVKKLVDDERRKAKIKKLEKELKKLKD